MIATCVGLDHKNWDEHLYKFRHAVKTAVQSSIKVSPAFLDYGCHPRPVKSLRTEVEDSAPMIKIGPEVWEDRIKRLDALRDLIIRFIN